MVGSLTDTYNRSGILKFGQFNEFKLTVPKYVERKHKQVEYKDYHNIRERFLVEVKYGNVFSEWMIVTGISKVKDKMPEKQVTLKSRQFELNGKKIRNFQTGSWTVDLVLSRGLEGTGWTIGYIDPHFEKLRRTFDEAKTSVLSLLDKIAESFGGVLQFDTYNRTVSLYKQETLEKDLGLHLSYGKYIQSLSQESNAEAMVTRLYIYGKDDLSIESVNPTGEPYLEDFSYFMVNYKTDELGNVISSSPYMSDGLVQAILNHNDLIKSKEIEYKGYIEQRQPYKEQMNLLIDEMDVLISEYDTILNNLDKAKADENQTDIDKYKADRAAKQSVIDSKQLEIDNVQSNIDLIDAEIKVIYQELSVENNFTPEQIEERELYIYEEIWEDNRYTLPGELYEAGLEKLKANNEPKRDLDFSLVQFLSVVEAQKDWNRIGLGYVVHADYEPLDIEFKAIISEITIGFDTKDLNLVISNTKYLNEKQKLAQTIYKTAVDTSLKVNQNSFRWNDGTDKVNEIERIMNSAYDATSRRIIAGVDESVTVDERGIIIRNPNFPEEVIVIQSGVIALSLDNSESWSTALSARGIVAQKLIGKILMGESLTIGDDEGTFSIVGNVLTIKDRNNVERVKLGEYSANQFGLKLMNKSGKNVVLDENGLLQSWGESASDNVDQNNGLSMYVYLPDTTLEKRQVKLRFKLLPFRSYSGTTASGGQSTVTSSSGGGTSRSTSSGGGRSITSAAGGDHSHLMFRFVSEGGIIPNHRRYIPSSSAVSVYLQTVSNNDLYTAGSSGNHSHSINLDPHTHDFTVDNHSHSVQILPHTHGISHGIYTGTTATNVGVIINGTNRTSALGGAFTKDQDNLDITQYMQIGQWNEIILTSSRLGRISANIFVQALMSHN